MNPWDNDPIVSQPTNSAPWENDPIAAPQQQGLISKIGEAAQQSATALGRDIGNAFPNPNDQLARIHENAAKYGVIGGFGMDALDNIKRAGSFIKAPFDLTAIGASPITGTARATLGNAYQAAANALPKPSYKTAMNVQPVSNEEANRFADTAMMLLAPGQKTGQIVPSTASQPLQDANQAGYKIPPGMDPNVELGPAGSALKGIGGKIKTQQLASQLNQTVTNDLAASELGLSADDLASPGVFSQIRQQASQTKSQVVNSLPRITPDQDFTDAVSNLGAAKSAAKGLFPKTMANPEVDDLVSEFTQANKPFDTQAGLDAVQQLRSEATANFKAYNDPKKLALARTQRGIADAIDSLMERNLASSQPDLVDQYRSARQLMAKSFDVEAATNTATGDVNAQTLARLLKKGRPLSGNLETIAQTAKAFPKALQNTSSFGGVEPFSALDAANATWGAVSGRPEVVGTVLGRPLARQLLLSNMIQKSMVSPTRNYAPLLLPSVAGATRANE